MVAILGADSDAIDKFCAENAQGEVLVPANYNAPGQIVVSGSSGACDRILKAAEAAGFKATALNVAGAFHSPLMQSAANRMGAELDKVTFDKTSAVVYSNVTGRPHQDVMSMKRLLVEQIVSPVRWEQTMQALIANGEARFVELAPGRTLAGLAKRINRRLPIESLSTVDSLSATKAS
jgi:[acyl-carrier-protein] S-malonyltransferase